MLEQCLCFLLTAKDEAQVFNRVQSFRAINGQTVLYRGTVRRGRLGGSSILRFASELKNRLLHIFRLEAKASLSGRRKRIGTQEPRPRAETGRGYNWQGLARNETGKDAAYAADGTLAFRAVAGFKSTPALAGRIKERFRANLRAPRRKGEERPLCSTRDGSFYRCQHVSDQRGYCVHIKANEQHGEL